MLTAAGRHREVCFGREITRIVRIREGWTQQPCNPKNGEVNALLLPVKIREGETSLSVCLAEETGRNFSVSYGMGERVKSNDGAISFGAAVTAWTMSDPQRLRSVQISGECWSMAS